MLTKEEDLIFNVLLSKKGISINNNENTTESRKQTRKQIRITVKYDIARLTAMQAIKKIY